MGEPRVQGFVFSRGRGPFEGDHEGFTVSGFQC